MGALPSTGGLESQVSAPHPGVIRGPAASGSLRLKPLVPPGRRLLIQVRLHRGRTCEPLALVIGDKLMISKTSLVQLSTLLLDLCGCSFACGFLLGHTGASFRKLRLLAALIRGATMFTRDLFTPLPQLSLAGANPRTLTRPRRQQRQREQYQYDHNDHDDHDDHCR